MKNLLSRLCIVFAALTYSAGAADGFKNESEAGIAISSGNTDTQSYNFKQANSYEWSQNALKFDSRFFQTYASGVENARTFGFGLRYERSFSDAFSLYAGPAVEGAYFAGILQRYNTDLGAKFVAAKSETFSWHFEGGYRYTVENRTTGLSVSSHYLRAYTEAAKSWNKSVSSKYWLEVLPNLSNTADLLVNSELSTSAALNDIFSVKLAYLVKFDSQPSAPRTLDTLFTTALVAKF